MSAERPSSQALRERFEREYLLPLARAAFELEPRCQSVLVTVGQYWCDEAEDAVHCHELACTVRDPAWPDAGQVHPGSIGDPQELAELLRDEQGMSDPEPGDLALTQHALWAAARKRAFGAAPAWVLDDNTDMIVAFASYCEEASDQEQPSWRSHTPYCLIRRPAQGQQPEALVVGRMHRPEWEDRWDAVEPDLFAGEALPRAAHGGPALLGARRRTLAPRARRGLWVVAILLALASLALVVGSLRR